MNEIKAIYPGSFDPMTLGHLDIVERASNIFPKLVVAVSEDSNKVTMFSSQERLQIARNEISKSLPDRKIEVVSFKGLLIKFAQSIGAIVLVRGMRAVSDFEYEFQMAYMNSKLAAELQTVFLPASEKSHFISSRFVKELARLNGELRGFVSDDVKKRLIEYYKNK
jgi:pantetheine-phosphate adenylyltransferase